LLRLYRRLRIVLRRRRHDLTSLVLSISQKLSYGRGYLLADSSEYLSPLFGGLCDGCGILETPMDESDCSGPTRATLFVAIAHRDHIVDGLRRILRDVLRSVTGDVDPDFSHGVDRSGVQADRLRASTAHVIAVAR
jgi:hypothetical protein